MKAPIILLFLLATQISFSQWESCSADIFGGNIKAIYADKDRVYAGTDIGLFISSRDGGAWRYLPIYQTSPIKSIAEIDGIIIVGTDHGIFYSTDEGENWTNSEVGTPINNVNSLAVTSSKIYAATSLGLFQTTDLAGAWTQISAGLPTGSANALAISDSVIMVNISGQTFGYYRSSDYGASWTKIIIDSVTTNFTNITLSKEVVFASAGDIIFYSTDKGLSFDIGVSLPHPGNAILSLAADSNKVLIGTFTGAYIYDWQTKSFEYSIKNESTISVAVIGGIYYAGDYNSLYRSIDKGNTWESMTKRTVNQYTFDLASNESMLLAGNIEGLYISWDYGTSWLDRSKEFRNKQIVQAASHGDKIVTLTQSDSIYYSADNGASWIPATNIFPIHIGPNYIATLALDNDHIFAGTAFGVYASSDRGATWYKRSMGFQYEDIRSLSVKGDSLYAGTLEHGVQLSTDKGLTWLAKTEGLDASPIYDIAISGNEFVAACYTFAQYSSDCGDRWVKRDLPVNYSYPIERVAIKADTILTSTANGIIISTDAGISWKIINGNTDFHFATDVAIVGDYMFVANDKGVFRAKLSDIGDLSAPIPGPTISDMSIYPNPFSVNAKIAYFLNEPMNVSISLFDIRGIKIETLRDEYQSGGYHEAECANKGLAPGCYYIQIHAGTRIITKKVIALE